MMKSLMVLTLSLFFLPAAMAGHTGPQGALIKNLRIHANGNMPVVMFSTSVHTGMPACASNGAREWAMPLDTFGQHVYSIVLSAYSQNKRVMIHGANDCFSWTDRESITHIAIVENTPQTLNAKGFSAQSLKAAPENKKLSRQDREAMGLMPSGS